MKNMLYRRTDDVEKLQKVIADTEQQFIDCLQQIKKLGKEKWWIRWKMAQQTGDPCWSDFAEFRRKSSPSSPRPPQQMLPMP
jgi:hypothetical protein